MLCGIPFIDSPSEAESQCAKLNSLGLVDAIISDDNDVFLFGAKLVYKKIFKKNDTSLTPLKIEAEKIRNILNLDQDSLIGLAFLLGSDYTLGIKGLGPVFAKKVLQYLYLLSI